VAREDVDAVYVSTVNRLHGEHTLLAAAAGRRPLGIANAFDPT